MSIFLSLIACWMCLGIRFNKEAYASGLLPKTTTTVLKGYSILFILITHVAQKLPEKSGIGHLKFLGTLGYLGVALFFFLSGYGLMTAFKAKRESYTAAFPSKRFPAIIVPYAIAAPVYLLTKVITSADRISTLREALASPLQIVDYSWFCITILLLYLGFYISVRVSRADIQIAWINTILICLYFLSCHFLGLQS